MHIDIGTQHRLADRVEGDMQTLFFLEQGFVKFFNFSHVHIDAEQAFDFALLVEHPIRQRADMTHTLFDAYAEFELKRHALHQGIADHLFSMLAILRKHALVPQLPGRFDMRRNLVHLEHTFVPADHIRL
ncbi:hypothetical protein D3C81_1619920 [compost metagenome]